jgi:hypothetical protein
MQFEITHTSTYLLRHAEQNKCPSAHCTMSSNGMSPQQQPHSSSAPAAVASSCSYMQVVIVVVVFVTMSVHGVGKLVLSYCEKRLRILHGQATVSRFSCCCVLLLSQHLGYAGATHRTQAVHVNSQCTLHTITH